MEHGGHFFPRGAQLSLYAFYLWKCFHQILSVRWMYLLLVIIIRNISRLTWTCSILWYLWCVLSSVFDICDVICDVCLIFVMSFMMCLWCLWYVLWCSEAFYDLLFEVFYDLHVIFVMYDVRCVLWYLWCYVFYECFMMCLWCDLWSYHIYSHPFKEECTKGDLAYSPAVAGVAPPVLQCDHCKYDIYVIFPPKISNFPAKNTFFSELKKQNESLKMSVRYAEETQVDGTVKKIKKSINYIIFCDVLWCCMICLWCDMMILWYFVMCYDDIVIFCDVLWCYCDMMWYIRCCISGRKQTARESIRRKFRETKACYNCWKSKTRCTGVNHYLFLTHYHQNYKKSIYTFLCFCVYWELHDEKCHKKVYIYFFRVLMKRVIKACLNLICTGGRPCDRCRRIKLPLHCTNRPILARIGTWFFSCVFWCVSYFYVIMMCFSTSWTAADTGECYIINMNMPQITWWFLWSF